jgi:hypothetical protein
MQRKLRMNLVPWRTPDVTMRIWELGKVPPQIGPLVDGGINMSTREILVLKTANERIPWLFDQFFTHFLDVANFPLAQMRHERRPLRKPGLLKVQLRKTWRRTPWRCQDVLI